MGQPMYVALVCCYNIERSESICTPQQRAWGSFLMIFRQNCVTATTCLTSKTVLTADTALPLYSAEAGDTLCKCLHRHCLPVIRTHEFLWAGIVVLHFEEEEQVILSPSVQVESGDPGADAIIKTVAAPEKNWQREWGREDLQSLQFADRAVRFGFSWNAEKHLQKKVRCSKAATAEPLTLVSFSPSPDTEHTYILSTSHQILKHQIWSNLQHFL